MEPRRNMDAIERSKQVCESLREHSRTSIDAGRG